MIPRRRRASEALAVAVAPDGNGSLAHGVVVDTRIVAKLFRVPVLRLEGKVVLSPSRFVPLTQPHVTVRPDHAPSPAPSPRKHPNGRIGVQLPEVSSTLARLRTGQGARSGPG